MKFCYGWLLIDGHLSTIDLLAETQCLSCGSIETHSHLWTCSCPHRALIRGEFLEHLHDLCNSHKLPVDFHRWLTTAIKSWFQNELNDPGQRTRDARFAPIERAQALIGWGQFFRGRITTALQVYVNSNRESSTPPNQYESMKWSVQLIGLIWETFESLWKLRNESRHGSTVKESNDCIRKRLLSDVDDLYSLRDQLPLPEQRSLFPPKARLVKKSNYLIESWCSETRKTIDYLLNVNSLADDDPKESSSSRGTTIRLT